MPFPLKDDFASNQPISAVGADWYNTVASILNYLRVQGGVINKTTNPCRATPWELQIDAGSGGGGLPDGTVIPWDVEVVDGKYADHVEGTQWLRQNWRKWDENLNEFVQDLINYPQTDIFELTSVPHWTISRPYVTLDSTAGTATIKYYWTQLIPTADTTPANIGNGTHRIDANVTDVVAYQEIAKIHASDHTEGIL